MPELKLSTPWQTYYRQVYALFDPDPEVAVMFDDGEEKVLTLYVDNGIKANAIAALMPTEKQFGNVTVKVNVVPSNAEESTDMLFRHAFCGNPIFSDVEVAEGIFTNPIYYVIFEPSIVQFWNDDLSDANGVCTTLPQDVAKEVFESKDGVFFCTELIEDYVSE